MPEERLQRKVAYLKFAILPSSELYIADQLNALERYDPLLLTSQAPGQAGLREDAVCALHRLSLSSRAVNGLVHGLSGRYPYFDRQVQGEGCRLVHALGGAEGVYAARLGAHSRPPLVTTFEGTDLAGKPQHLRRRYARLFAEGDRFLASSEAVRKQLLNLGCPGDRLKVHHVGVDVERIPFRERRPDGGSVNVLLVGRMVERKGFPYGLQAFAGARRYRRNATLTLIGDGPGRPAVEAQLREFNLAGVRLLGMQPHDVVLNEMLRAHILVLPSVTTAAGEMESIPLTLLEAQATGLPVVSTWHSGIPEVIVDGRSGYLVSERNSHALAERLRQLMEHPQLWGPFGRAGRAIVEERFSLRRQAAALEACYDELLGDEASAQRRV